jgi:hypothetical protein
MVLHGCETWSLTLREAYTEGVCEQGPENNRTKVILNERDWRKLYNEELHNLYTSTVIITMIISHKERHY